MSLKVTNEIKNNFHLLYEKLQKAVQCLSSAYHQYINKQISIMNTNLNNLLRKMIDVSYSCII